MNSTITEDNSCCHLRRLSIRLLDRRHNDRVFAVQFVVIDYITVMYLVLFLPRDGLNNVFKNLHNYLGITLGICMSGLIPSW
jgi:hypothetical protein